MFNNLLGAAQRFVGNTAQKVQQAAKPIVQQAQKTAQPIVNKVQSVFNPQPVKAQTPAPRPAPAAIRQPAPLPPAATSNPRLSLTQSSSNRLPSSPSFNAPSPSQFGVPSMEDAARRFAQDQMDKYAELVAPREQAIASYLESRQPYSQVYEGKLNELGAMDIQRNLSGFEKDIMKLQGDLETLPKEDIARRADSGMLTEAARRRIQAAEERPIRDQLFKTDTARQTSQIGYDRALQLAGQYADSYAQDTEQGLRPLQSALDAARSQYGQFVDSVSQQLSGFTADREALLRQYEGAVDQGYQLSQIQAQQATQLKQQEDQHIKTMQLTGALASDSRKGLTLNSVMGKYLAQGLDPDTILSLYNSYSIYGPAKESANTLMQQYGVGSSRYNAPQGGSSLQSLVNQGA